MTAARCRLAGWRALRWRRAPAHDSRQNPDSAASFPREPLISKFLGDAPGVTNNTVDQHLDILKSTGDIVIAVPKPNDQCEREKLIRRRWTQMRSKYGIPGAAHAALNIQGRVDLLAPKPGETLPGYDKLEFKLIGYPIICEGAVVDPPNGQGNSQFAGPAICHSRGGVRSKD